MCISLTHTGVSVFLKSSGAHTPPDGHQPLPLSAAVHLGRVPLLSMIHTLTPDLHQWGRVGSRHHVCEHRQVPAHAHAAFVVDADGREGNASTDVLESQVEAAFVQRAHTSHLEGEEGGIHISISHKGLILRWDFDGFTVVHTLFAVAGTASKWPQSSEKHVFYCLWHQKIVLLPRHKHDEADLYFTQTVLSISIVDLTDSIGRIQLKFHCFYVLR